MEISVAIPKKLIKEQFPQWQELKIYPVAIKVKIRLPKLLQISGYTLH